MASIWTARGRDSPGKGRALSMSSLQGTRKGLRDTGPLRECGETWAHRALFLKKGLSEAELGSEPTSCPRPLTCAPSGFNVPPACEMEGDAEL